MKYKILSRDIIPEYISQVPAVAAYFGDETEFEIDEIGDGNLNYVDKVRSKNKSEKVVVLKQAVPYLRMVGEEWPLARDRMSFEIRALKQYNELVPASVPSVIHADEEMSVLIMQCLDAHKI